MDDDEEIRKPRKGKSSFFGSLFQKLLPFLVIFVIGLAVGVYVTNQFIDPALNVGASQEKKLLEERNVVLDQQVDSYYTCLQTFAIDPQTCQRQSPGLGPE